MTCPSCSDNPIGLVKRPSCYARSMPSIPIALGREKTLMFFAGYQVQVAVKPRPEKDMCSILLHGRQFFHLNPSMAAPALALTIFRSLYYPIHQPTQWQ
ncbi:hypothetical protein M413DRAFT_278689 [Hebeloma cylindrosporum]|uniref:Uncharacterized protein n=1 Tax=Hebeloma cylindrosporum TaxID=76867 RepID=A0A0C2Y835_HEBCY|nr:hypothetical protein M413DRAFT_278689 [Hebeloma cylindrosporum h7]